MMIEVQAVPPTPEEEEALKVFQASVVEHRKQAAEEERRLAYQREADPLFFKWQAGEVSKQDWLDARAAVVEQYPDAIVEL